jgi:hypothetical protein
MKVLKPLLAIALVSALTTVNAQAIGNREKGALMGAGIMLLLPTLTQNVGALFGAQDQTPQRRQYDEPAYETREVVIVERAPRYKRGHAPCYERYEEEPYRRKTIIIER